MFSRNGKKLVLSGLSNLDEVSKVFVESEEPKIILGLLPNEWVIMGCCSDGLEHTGQDFQAEMLLIA